MYAFPYSVFPVFHTVFADFTRTHRRGVFCNIYTYFIHTVRIYVISGPGSRYFPTLVPKQNGQTHESLYSYNDHGIFCLHLNRPRAA